MSPSERLRQELVDVLVGSGAVRSDAIRKAFLSVRRELFVPHIAAVRGLSHVYSDQPLITQERDGIATSSSSQPTVMAQMLEALDVRPGQRVLEIGLGTGYNAALLSLLAGNDGRVASIDIDAGLVQSASVTLRRGGYAVDAAVADGRAGWPPGAPYDRIIATASVEAIPRAWRDQLAPGGLLVVPMRVDALQVIAVLEPTAEGFRSIRLIPGGFMPMRGPDAAEITPTSGSVMVRTDVLGRPGKVRTRSATGPGLLRLSARAQLHLVTNLLSQPDWTAQDPHEMTGLIWHTALTGDPRRQITVYLDEPGWRFGVVDRQSGAFSTFLGRQNTLLRLESYGNDRRGRTELTGHLQRWKEAGAPGIDRLFIEVSYGPARRGLKATAARTIRRSDQILCFSWE